MKAIHKSHEEKTQTNQNRNNFYEVKVTKIVNVNTM